MQKDRRTKVFGFLMALALVSVVMAGPVSSATHTVLGESGTATW
jgi:hypothetical protein